MNRTHWLPAGLFAAALIAPPLWADTLDRDEALTLLQRIADAARQLNYAGTFIFQHGDRVQTSRIVHFVDERGEHEKLETLDGPRREVIRNNDEVLCYYPELKMVRSDPRVGRRSFPALLPEQLSGLAENYQIRMGEAERVAGYDAQALVLEPRDGLRYGHKIWADSVSGLLLKSRMLNEAQEVVEQFSFTQLSIGAGVTKEMIRPSFDVRPPQWRLNRFGNSQANNNASGWVLKNFPAGFRKILEMQRVKPGQSSQVTHIVFSDGLAAISIFIEPAANRRQVSEGLVRQGAINIYTRTLNDQVITVLGETPAPTVMQMARSISQRGQ
jgi:sigma-E factor negative regulatory protein RseB